MIDSSKINRRVFIKEFAALSAISLIPKEVLALEKRYKQITILHTNDQHSRIEPFPTMEDPTYSNKGGFARRASLIAQIRATHPNVVLLDAGDVFQGTPYFNFYGGKLEFKLMSLMSYDAMNIGNHEFDNGLSGIEKAMPEARFDVIASNYDFSNTQLDGRIKSFKIIEKAGVKIGIFGLGIALKGLVDKKCYLETNYLDPIEITQDKVRFLREEKNCDLVICLSHLGYSYEDKQRISDVTLAKKTHGIDLIIGGHTHTFLQKPISVKNTQDKITLINQVGWAGLFLGKIDFFVTPNNKLSFKKPDLNEAIAINSIQD